MIRTMASVLALSLAASVGQAATVTVTDSTAPWLGFMNVSNLDGSPAFASGWGVSDLTATFDDPAGTLTLSPNTVGDPNEFWYQNTTGTAPDPTNPGGPGQAGNKIMEANLFQQVSDGSLSGTTVTFEGTILSNTYTAAHEASIFIRDFAPDFSSFNETIVPADAGPFSISLATDAGAGRNVQYGFQSRGVNVWVTDTAPFGSVVIGTIPEPTSAVLLGMLGVAGLAVRRR